MKTIIVIAAALILTGCSSADKKTDTDTARQSAIDSMQNAMMQQHLEDSLAAASNTIAAPTPEATNAEPASPAHKAPKEGTVHHKSGKKDVPSTPGTAPAPAPTPTKETANTPPPTPTTTPQKTEGGTAGTEPSKTATTAPDEEKKKKGLNNAAKGAIIGLGTGAAAGAVIGGKDNRVKGAVIGGILGAGAGAVGGAVLDKRKKNKDSTAKRDTTRK